MSKNDAEASRQVQPQIILDQTKPATTTLPGTGNIQNSEIFLRRTPLADSAYSSILPPYPPWTSSYIIPLEIPYIATKEVTLGGVKYTPSIRTNDDPKLPGKWVVDFAPSTDTQPQTTATVVRQSMFRTNATAFVVGFAFYFLHLLVSQTPKACLMAAVQQCFDNITTAL
jgi:hypothetical protein